MAICIDVEWQIYDLPHTMHCVPDRRPAGRTCGGRRSARRRRPSRRTSGSASPAGQICMHGGFEHDLRRVKKKKLTSQVSGVTFSLRWALCSLNQTVANGTPNKCCCEQPIGKQQTF